MTCPHCAALEEEIAYLKDELALTRSKDVVDRLRRHFRLSGQQATVLAALYNARGRCLQQWFLEEIAPPVADKERQPKHMQVQICNIRNKVGKGAIETVWGAGYRITDLGRLLCEEALEARAMAA